MKHFKYRDLSELQRSSDELHCSAVQVIDNTSRLQAALGRPVQRGRVHCGNSMAIHPMEGCDGDLDGTPGELTWRRYERFARGGAKLIWFEATAVREDGRANTRQLWITEKNRDQFARLYEHMMELHRAEYGSADDLLVPVQLTHSGRYSVPVKTVAYHNPLVDEKHQTPADYPVITDDEIERLEDDYVAAAKIAWKAGFRAFDVKVTHGYLMSELMGAKLREGRYGGPIENRARMPVNILRKLRDALGPEAILCMRLGCFDGVPYRKRADGVGEPIPYPVPYPHGFGVNPQNPLEPDLTDVKAAIQLFKDAGLELLNVSLGCPYYNPHIGRPFESPDEGNYEQPEHPLHGVNRHFSIAGELQRAFPDLPMVGTGYSWLQRFAIHAAAHNIEQGAITFFGIGRGALAYPDFARAVLECGELDDRKTCKTLTYCTYLMRRKDHPLGQWPTGCPPFDKEVYGPVMKEARAVQRTAKA
jgi:2,4-dienoyl-CoA reductase-like NADH-dependent reductase (Old Yellow Enzyme family)